MSQLDKQVCPARHGDSNGVVRRQNAGGQPKSTVLSCLATHPFNPVPRGRKGREDGLPLLDHARSAPARVPTRSGSLVSPGNGRFAHPTAATTETVVMDSEAIRRALLRIAHEILEHHSQASDLVLVGMRTRGVPLAERIAGSIEEFDGERLEIGVLDIALHRDDLSLRNAPPVVRPGSLPESIDDRVVVLLDDVLFTGRSIRAALDAVTDYGRPAAIELAVLVDRGHRELPIRPDYVGKNIPTHRDDVVEVHLSEVDDGDSVIVRGAALDPNEEADPPSGKPAGELTSEQEA